MKDLIFPCPNTGDKMDTTNKYIEKRNYARVSLCLEYTLDIGGDEYSGITGNISQGGTYLLIVAPLLKEDALFQNGTITINLDDNLIALPCSITYVGTEQSEHPTGIGIAFSEDAIEQRDKILEFITAKL